MSTRTLENTNNALRSFKSNFNIILKFLSPILISICGKSHKKCTLRVIIDVLSIKKNLLKKIFLLLLFRPTDPYFSPSLPVNLLIKLVSPYPRASFWNPLVKAFWTRPTGRRVLCNQLHLSISQSVSQSVRNTRSHTSHHYIDI